MRDLLKFEFRKLSKNLLFYILGGVLIAMTLLSAVLTRVLLDTMHAFGDDSDAFAQVGGLALSASTYFLQGLYQSQITLILAVFVCLFALRDNNGPIKTVISKGYSREKVFFAKYLVSLSAALFYAVASISLSYPIALLVFGEMGELPSNIWLLLLGQVLSVAAMQSVYFSVAYSIGKTPLAMLSCIILPTVVALICQLIDGFANTSEITVSQFWLGSLLNSFSYPNTSDSGLIISFSMGGAYIAASIVVGALISKKKQY